MLSVASAVSKNINRKQTNEDIQTKTYTGESEAFDN